MPYVVRQSDGSVKAIFKNASAESNEYLPANHPDIAEFIEGDVKADLSESVCLEQEDDVHTALKSSDADIARVTEDLVYLLVKKNVILFTELPEMVQEKLISREKLRSKLKPIQQSIISDDETF